MRSIELEKKAAAAEAKVIKIEGTIERHKKAAEKKLAIILKNNWNPTDKYQKEGTKEHDDCYWSICEYEGKLEDIKSAEKKLKAAQEILANWKTKLKEQIKKENTIATEMPEIFRQCQQELADEWTQYDIAARERMKAKRAELGYKEFRKIYKFNQEQELNKSDEEFIKSNLQSAESFIIDLYNKVKAITGDVTDWSHIRYSGKALNGLVIGKDGKAAVETIVAGGYNIQRIHYRVLVKKLK